MPWAEDNIEMPNNYFSALAQLKYLEKRLRKDQSSRGKVFEYHQRGPRQGLRTKGQRCSLGGKSLETRVVATTPSGC